MTGGDYWLIKWLDENEIKNERDLERSLSGNNCWRNLASTAAGIEHTVPEPLTDGSVPIVAGSSIDLSGELSCAHFDCMRSDVDNLFNRMWHYFDVVVVRGAVPSRFEVVDDTSANSDIARRTLHGHLRNALYLRNSGAADMMVFRDRKYDLCEKHYRELAEVAGVLSVMDKGERKRIIGRLEASGRLQVDFEGGSWSVRFTHPDLPEPYRVQIVPISGSVKKPTKNEIAANIYYKYSSALVGDAFLARNMHAALAQEATPRWAEPPKSRKGKGKGKAADPDELEALIALNLNLPTLSNLTAQEIFRLRQEQQPYFDKFRQALRVAIRSQIEQAGSASPQAIAQRVSSETVIPALADIETRLRANRRSFSSSLTVDGLLTTVAATVGLLGTVPLSIGGAVAAAGGVAGLTYWNSYCKDRSEVELSDMYFLWKLQKAEQKKYMKHS